MPQQFSLDGLELVMVSGSNPSSSQIFRLASFSEFPTTKRPVLRTRALGSLALAQIMRNRPSQ